MHNKNTTASGAADQYPSLYERTKNIEDINTLLVPRASLAAKAPAAPIGWYALAADGMATLCVDRDDAEKEAANSEKKWPHLGPYRAVQLYTAPPAPTEQWRDIETAPEDGSRLILAEAEKVFHGGFVGVQFKEHRDADGNYIDQTDPDAYWLNFEDGDVCHPTHWQPEPALPAPPQGAAKGDGNGL